MYWSRPLHLTPSRSTTRSTHTHKCTHAHTHTHTHTHTRTRTHTHTHSLSLSVCTKQVVDTLCPTAAPDMRGLVIDSTVVLDVSACAALMDFVDTLRKTRLQHSRIDSWHGKHDEQVDISPHEMARLIGGQQYQRLVRLYHSDAHADAHSDVDHDAPFDSNPSEAGVMRRITIRRVEATEQQLVIAFHTDTAARKTLQVALNPESEYDGGCLVYATNTGFLRPARPRGSYTKHLCHMPHGVTALKRGVRYSIFLH